MDSSNSGFEDNEQRKQAYVQKLHDDIIKLPAKKKQRVVDIIAKDIEFIQVHLIELKPTTLKKMEKYTKSCLEKMTQKPENDNQEAGTQEMKKRPAQKRVRKDDVKPDGAGMLVCTNTTGKGLCLTNVHK